MTHITKREDEAWALIAAPLPKTSKAPGKKKRTVQHAPPDVLRRHEERCAAVAVAEFIALLGRLMSGKERRPRGDGGWHHMSDRRIEAAHWAVDQHEKALARA